MSLILVHFPVSLRHLGERMTVDLCLNSTVGPDIFCCVRHTQDAVAEESTLQLAHPYPIPCCFYNLFPQPGASPGLTLPLSEDHPNIQVGREPSLYLRSAG